MSNSVWTVIFAIGAAQGLFLCGALLLRRAPNRSATRLLAAVVGVATAMIGVGALIPTLPDRSGQLLSYLHINSELALGPLLLLFARALVDPDRRLVRRDALHFLPLVLGVIVWGSTWAVLGDVGRRDALFDHQTVVPLFLLFKASWLFGYIAMTYRTLSCDARISRLHVAGRRQVQLNWLRNGLLAVAVLAGTIYLAAFAERFGFGVPLRADPYGSLILAVAIYLVSLMVLLRPWILALRVRPTPDRRWKADVARLTAHLEERQPWRQPDLTLGDLSSALGLTKNQLSAAIHEGLNTTFYTLVNRYRLAEFERLARHPSWRDRSVLDLAFEAGFNSKASFYRLFREIHGTTPTAFRRAI